MFNFETERSRMMEEQIAGRGVKDERVLQAMRKVPRHEFLPEALRGVAYGDHALPIGEGQTISQPYMVALMTEALELEGPERVLEVGAGTGYQAAVLAALCAQVYSIERVAELAESARQRLASLGVANVEIGVGDGTLGWPEHAPYDGIIVTAGAPRPPAPLVEQLADGGRLVIPVGDRQTQMLKVYTRHGETHRERNVCACKFVPLVGAHGWPDRSA